MNIDFRLFRTSNKNKSIILTLFQNTIKKKQHKKRIEPKMKFSQFDCNRPCSVNYWGISYKT